MCISPQGDTKRARKTKVCELEIVVLIDEQVLRLEISVKNAVRVAVEKAG